MKKIFFSCFVALSFCGYSQDITVLKGDLGFFKGQTDIKIEFDYENIFIEGGGTEKEYKGRKIEYLNKKEAGRGDKFERTWNQFRLDYFEPKFMEVFFSYSRLKPGNDTAKYVLIFKPTRYIDKALLVPPNEEAKPSSKTTFMDGEAWVVETKNRENVLLKLSIKKIPGRDNAKPSWGYGPGYTHVGSNGIPVTNGGSNYGNTMAYYDVRTRLSFCYSQAGKELGKYMWIR